MEGQVFSREETNHSSSSESHLQNRHHRCFSLFPCFTGNNKTSSSGEVESNRNCLWDRGVTALKKIREWSELVAGPSWKTFIRRFNRNRSGATKHVNFQYDPMSYAMNFDEGPGLNGHCEEEGDDGYYYASRNFSSRYANGSMDLGKDGPTFV